jgi:hypothetical protein
MRSRLTTLLTVGFVIVGTGAALALSGGASFGLGGHGARSASVSQYRPPFETPPVPTKGPPVSTPPVQTPPVPTPPASKSHPRQAAAALSKHGVATVRCPAVCHIVLRARRGSHRVHVALTLRANGTAIVRLSKRDLKRLGRGRSVLSIYVDGKLIATRTVSVP